jgi:hypothetical protein
VKSLISGQPLQLKFDESLDTKAASIVLLNLRCSSRALEAFLFTSSRVSRGWAGLKKTLGFKAKPQSFGLYKI